MMAGGIPSVENTPFSDRTLPYWGIFESFKIERNRKVGVISTPLNIEMSQELNSTGHILWFFMVYQ